MARADSHQQGRTLARKRRAIGLTQHQLAAATSIPINKIVYIETGRAVPLPSELDAIRSVLKKRARQVVAMVGA